ncbi:MAG: sulfotransferase [Myxococcota bacterium]|jgi:hypothetical protein|nr:sulfotransferase [Myxococcota bacterium]
MHPTEIPVRPRTLRGLDALGRTLNRVGWKGFALDVETLLASARRETRLEDLGGNAFMPALKLLVDSIENQARLSPFGRYFARRQLVEVLMHRLRMTDYRHQHPEVGEQQIRRPLLVLGLPRTGTTLLYELLAQDPAHRAPRSWELDDPCPAPTRSLGADDPRVKRCEKRMAALRAMSPGFQAIHPIGAMLPQECLVATAYAVHSVRFELCFDVPAYQDWLTHQDMAYAYQVHFEILQHLQSQQPTERWVLKSPGHLGTFDSILQRYPDAMMVQTHRDPQKVIPSLASLYANMRSIATEDLRIHEIGEQVLRTWSSYLDRGIQKRSEQPDKAEHIVDIQFDNLVANPIDTVKAIYRHFELPLGPETLRRMRHYLEANRRHRHGVHRYEAGTFGLEAGQIESAFKRYSDHFDIPREK